MTPTAPLTLRDALTSLLVAVVFAFVAYLNGRKTQAAKPVALNTAMLALGTVAANVVAETWQTTVAALKDPEKAGAWDATAKREAAQNAQAALIRVGSVFINVLRENGMKESSINILLSTLIEAEVARLNLSVQAAAPVSITEIIDEPGEDPPAAPIVTGKHSVS